MMNVMTSTCAECGVDITYHTAKLLPRGGGVCLLCEEDEGYTACEECQDYFIPKEGETICDYCLAQIFIEYEDPDEFEGIEEALWK